VFHETSSSVSLFGITRILAACHGCRVPVIRMLYLKSVDRGSTYMSLMYATGWEKSGWKTSARPLCWPRDPFVMENGSRIKLCYLNYVMGTASHMQLSILPFEEHTIHFDGVNTVCLTVN
jgi:hypothetical protein